MEQNLTPEESQATLGFLTTLQEQGMAVDGEQMMPQEEGMAPEGSQLPQDAPGGTGTPQAALPTPEELAAFIEATVQSQVGALREDLMKALNDEEETETEEDTDEA